MEEDINQEIRKSGKQERWPGLGADYELRTAAQRKQLNKISCPAFLIVTGVSFHGEPEVSQSTAWATSKKPEIARAKIDDVLLTQICFNSLDERCKVERGGFMTIWQIILLIAGCGAIGGIVNCAISGEFNYPRFDAAAKVWRPGWIGNVLVGAVASVVVWGIYGPLASFDLLTEEMAGVHLTVAQLLTSLVIGLSGGKILTLMAEKQAATISKDQLAAAVKALTKG